MFIQTEATPNPATLKFIPGRVVLDGGTMEFANREAAVRSPLAERLFGVPGVTGVFFGSDFITVTKNDGDWQHLKPAILGAIMEHYMSGAPLLADGTVASDELADEQDEFYSEEDADTVAQIKDLIETRVRPAVANDGGDITFRGFKDGVVYLNMKGACSGCPSSTATLQHGIQNLLRHFVPDVVEVRPIDRHEDEFAIGGLPEQKIGQPLFTAGADDHIGIRQIRLVEMTRQQFGRDLIDQQPPLAHFDGEPTRRACDFLPRAIVESDDQHQAVIALGQLFGFFKQSPDVGRQVLALADNPHADIAFVQIGEIVADEAPKQRQQVANFRLRPRPVFGAERKDGEYGNPEIAGGAHGLAQRLDPAAMPFHARQTARRGPAPVAVHDDSDMARHLEAAAIGERLR